MDLLFYVPFVFMILSIPFAVFFLKSYMYYQREVNTVNLIDFLKIIFYLKRPDSTQLRKYRAYTIFYAIGLNIVFIGLVLFILLNYNYQEILAL